MNYCAKGLHDLTIPGATYPYANRAKCTACYRANAARYNVSTKGRTRHERYDGSAKGHATDKRYSKSLKGWATSFRYEHSATRIISSQLYRSRVRVQSMEVLLNP